MTLKVTTNPHIKHRDTSFGIMLDVIVALIPALAAGVWLFGPRVLLVCLVSIGVAVASEHLFCKIIKKETTIGDLSCIVTGLLLALNLPVSIPLYMVAIGSFSAIVVVKMFFGGIGQNFANPAITARIILLVSFPAAMTHWVEPLSWLNKDIITSATPLASPAAHSLADLFIGRTGGCIGETSALMLLIGGIYLVARRVISPIIPLSFIISSGLLSLAFGTGFLSFIFSGGLMLGAIFMATDYTTSPTTTLGKLIFGIGCGVLTFIIRRFGAMAEGVSYAILIMNILVPHINRLTARKPFGWEVAKSEK